MPTTVDYEQDAADRVPPFLADGENLAKLIKVFALRWQELDDLTLQLAESIELTEESPTWVLELVGGWLNEPRRGGWDNEAYLYALRVKQRTRRSNGTWPDIYEVARLLRPGPPYAETDVDVFGAPKSVVVDIPELVKEWQQIIAKVALLRTVGATTQLALTVSMDGLAFTFDDDDLGWDNGLLVELV